MLRILLADDHAILRSGLRRIVAEAFPDATIEEADSCEGLHEMVRRASWSLLVLDIALQNRNSLELLPELRRLQPRMAVIVLSMYGDRQFVLSALRAGATGYLTKDRAPEELMRAIRSALEGKRYLCESVARELADHLALAGDAAEPPHKLLSPREYEVFLLLASARSVSEIAERLILSVKTVSTYRTRILEKMGLNSNAQLMQYAVRNGLLA